MSDALPSFRHHPNLHLTLTQTNGSPRGPYQSTPATPPLPTPFRTPVSTPSDTPLGITAYSPFPLTGLQAPSPFGDLISYRPRRKSHSNQHDYRRLPFKRLHSSKTLGLLLALGALALWWFNGGRMELNAAKMTASGLGREFLRERRMHEYSFYPATDPNIHYIGRWTSTPNRLRKDGTFPGVYFDVIVKNTSSLLVALHNAERPATITSAASSLETTQSLKHPHLAHLSFRPIPADEKAAPPVSLLAQVDDEEYVLLPSSSSLVSICSNDLDHDREHRIRIVAPMTDDHGRGVIELEGLWLSKGGTLIKVSGSLLREEYSDEVLQMADNDTVGEKERAALNSLEYKGSKQIGGQTYAEDNKDNEDLFLVNQKRKKLIEIITDNPGSFSSKRQGKRSGGPNGLLGGVIGWEYLIGEMFGADHVSIGVDGMCLTQDCIGSTGYPAGMGDVFFRSGPFGSAYFEHPWMFSAYIPDVLVLNLGASDCVSYHEHATDYPEPFWDLAERFESTYVSLVKGIRRLAYPKHPSIVQSERLGSPGIITSNVPASIPIFVMRPLRGELEQATQNAVSKLRADGDKSVFWLDTSGWLDPNLEPNPNVGEVGDYFLDESVEPSRWRLTEQGNQRVAIFLHMHVCRYLANDEEKCAFLPREDYQGKSFDPDEASLDRFLEREQERRLKKLFGETDYKNGHAS